MTRLLERESRYLGPTARCHRPWSLSPRVSLAESPHVPLRWRASALPRMPSATLADLSPACSCNARFRHRAPVKRRACTRPRCLQRVRARRLAVSLTGLPRGRVGANQVRRLARGNLRRLVHGRAGFVKSSTRQPGSTHSHSMGCSVPFGRSATDNRVALLALQPNFQNAS